MNLHHFPDILSDGFMNAGFIYRFFSFTKHSRGNLLFYLPVHHNKTKRSQLN